MKFITLLVSIFIASLTVNCQVKVYLRSGNIINTAPEKNPNNDAAYFADCKFDGKYFLWLQFNQIPIESEKENLVNSQ